MNPFNSTKREKNFFYISYIKNKFCFSFKGNFSEHTVKPVLSGHSKIDKTKILMTNGSFMKVKNIAECSAILLTCIKG